MSGENLRRYFRQLFTGDAVTPRQGSELTLETAAGQHHLFVQDVTNIGVHEDPEGRRAEQFSVILEGDHIEIDLTGGPFEFVDGAQRYSMTVRPFGPDGLDSQLYEGLFEIEE